MKYDRREIMRAAHHKHRRFQMTFAQALHLAWVEAKAKAARYDVYGENIRDDSSELIASGVPYEKAKHFEWFYKCSYDRITIKQLYP